MPGQPPERGEAAERPDDEGEPLAARYRRRAGRRGKKRALVAVGHTILTIISHVLKDQTTSAELGADYFDRLDAGRLTRSLVRRLEKLGPKVVLREQEPAT